MAMRGRRRSPLWLRATRVVGTLLIVLSSSLLPLSPATANDNDTLYTFAADNTAYPTYIVDDSYPQPYANFVVPKPSSGCWNWTVVNTRSYDAGADWLVTWDMNGSVSTCDWRIGIHNGF